MKKIMILLSAGLFLLASCATFPPPQIQDGRYINSKYGFSIKVPDGWYQTEKIPDDIKSAFTEQERARTSIMFFNNDTNGLILVSNDKTLWSFSSLYLAYDEMYNNIEKYLKKKKQEFDKDPYAKSFSYEIDSIDHWSESASYETEFQKLEARSEHFVYGCHKDDSCFVGIVLVSDIKTFDKNYKVFKRVVDSFQGWLL